MEETTVLVYDFDLKAPACVLIQAAYGCDTRNTAFDHFDPNHWLLAPTPGMRKVAGTASQWKRAAEITKKMNNTNVTGLAPKEDKTK